MSTPNHFNNILRRVLILISLLAMTTSAVADSKDVFVDVDWLHKNLDQVTLIDMSEQASYQKFHLPGALWVNYDWLIKPQDGLSLSGGLHYMAGILSQLGINNDSHIVIYDDIGGMEASRLYWELDKLNHPKVHILDGGLVSWVLAGKPVTQTLPKRPALANYQIPKQTFTNQLTADKEETVAAIQKQTTTLIDTRSKQEYIGHKKDKRSGHIPNAVWFEWSDALAVNNGFKQKSSDKLLSQLKNLGVTEQHQPIILYCNTAHRAARTFTMLKSLGFNDIKLYDGSLQEYALDKSLPLKRGLQP